MASGPGGPGGGSLRTWAAAAAGLGALVVVVLAVLAGPVVALVTAVLIGQVGTMCAVLLLRRELASQRGDVAVSLGRTERVARQVRRRLGRLERRSATSHTQLTTAAEVEARHHRDVMTEVRTARQHVITQGAHQHLDTQRQLQALLNLQRMVATDGAVPPMGGWAATPDLLELVVQELLERRPRTVVECGSGLSTLYLALAIDQADLPSRLVALDHDPVFAAETRQLLDRHGVGHRAEVRDAPLAAAGVADHDTHWYDRTATADLADVGLLLVDGPPAAGGPHARYPALPVLAEALAPRCLVVMDDLDRQSDREVAERWAREFPGFSLRVRDDFSKHVGLLRRD